MPQGDKDKYTPKQKRQAKHIADSYRQEGNSPKKAAERAWRTVNAHDGGGKEPGGSGRSGSGKHAAR